MGEVHFFSSLQNAQALSVAQRWAQFHWHLEAKHGARNNANVYGLPAVVDGYHFSMAFLKQLKADGFFVCQIDDMVSQPHNFADVIVNPHIIRQSQYYQNRFDAQLLLGAQYILLRPEFLKARANRRQTVTVARNILVTLGGSQVENQWLEILDWLINARQFQYDFRLLLPAGDFDFLEKIKGYKAQGLNVEPIIDTDNVAEHMRWADLAISAAGSTSWELAFMGVPSLLIVLASNQRSLAQALDETSMAINLGDWASLGAKALLDTLTKLAHNPHQRYQMAQNGQNAIDGQGSLRVLDCLRTRGTTIMESCE